jgi:hypothetical protein
MDYYNKYLKYKNKYLNLKNILDGSGPKRKQEEIDKSAEQTNLLLEYIDNKTDIDKIKKILDEGGNPLDSKIVIDEFFDDEIEEIPLKKIIKIYCDSNDEYYKNLISLFRNYINLEDIENITKIKTYISEDISKEQQEFLYKIFNLDKKGRDTCKQNIIKMKDLIISHSMIKAIASLSDDRKGRFAKLNFDEIISLLESEGFVVIDDRSGPLYKLDAIMTHEYLDDNKYPIKIILKNDKYEILDGRHRTVRALIDNKESICAIINK